MKRGFLNSSPKERKASETVAEGANGKAEASPPRQNSTPASPAPTPVIGDERDDASSPSTHPPQKPNPSPPSSQPSPSPDNDADNNSAESISPPRPPTPPPPAPSPPSVSVSSVTNRSATAMLDIPPTSTTAAAYTLVLCPSDEEGGGKGGEQTVDNLEIIDGRAKHEFVGLLPGRSYTLHATVVEPPHHPTPLSGEPSTFATDPSPPGPPASPTIGGKTKTSLKLRWQPPLEANGAPVTAYTLTIAEAGCSPAVVYSGPDTKFEAKGLRPGVEYTAKVSAENKAGTSDWSGPISVSTQSTVPSVPSEPLCSSIGFGFIGVTWNTPAETGGSEVTSYTLELEEGPEGAGFIAKYNGPNTGYVLQGAKPLLPYRFRVKAGNAVGWSHFSSSLEVMGSCGASGPPGIATLAGSSSYALAVSWTPPEIINGSPVTVYQVGMRVAVDDGVQPSNFVVVYTGEGCSCEISGLTPACTYEVIVVAQCPFGPSLPSPPALFTTSIAPPECIDPPYLLESSSTSLHVAWRPPAVNNGSSVKLFRLEAVGADHQEVMTVFEGMALDIPLTGLQAGKALWLRVSAANDAGYGPPSPTVCFTTGASPPSPPAIDACTVISKSSAEVSWHAPGDDGGMPVTSYKVTYTKRDEEGGKASGSKTIDGLQSCRCTLQGLSPGCNYTVSVQALNGAGLSGPSLPACFTTLPSTPSAPPTPATSEVTPSSVSLSWGEPSQLNGAPVVGYQLQMQDAAAGGGYATLYSGCLCSFEVDGLRPGAPYSFRVSASNSAGAGPYSQAAHVTMQSVAPGPPLAVTMLGVTHNGLKLKWSPPAFDGGCEPHSYAVILSEGGGGEGKEAWSGPTTSCKIKALPEQMYSITVVAYNAVGAGIPSQATTATTPPAPSKPEAAPRPPPQISPPSVSVKGPHNATIHWGGGGKDATYVVEVACGTGEGGGAFDEVYQGGGTSYDLQNLEAGSSYSVRVTACNAVGRSLPSVGVGFRTRTTAAVKASSKIPPPPGKLHLEKAGKTSLRLKWSEGAGDATGVSYCVELKEEGGEGEFVQVYSGAVMEYVIKKLKTKTRYVVRAKSQNRYGSSDYTRELVCSTKGETASSQNFLSVMVVVMAALFSIFWILMQEQEKTGPTPSWTRRVRH